MANHHPQLARLHIPQQGSPPIPQPLYTGLPSAIQQSFNMHTPLQSNFGPQIPLHPHPRHGMHRAHPSLMFPGPAAALAAAGIAPPSGMPVTPGGMPPHIMLGGPGFQRGSRRTPSVSTGGPPKAPLGGPNRKHSPMPAGLPATGSNLPASGEKPKPKKVNMKLPVERLVQREDEDEERVVYSLWSRRPLADSAAPIMDGVKPPDILSMEAHPIEQSNALPATIDVFLPGKTAWDEYKQKLIEEKLQRLGVERGGNSAPSSQSHLHGRAASISSPADPALLLFKLNKLQQSQAGSISVSPQPPSIPVSPVPPRFQNTTSRHGHSFSLANYTTPPPQQPQFYNPNGSFNQFGSGAILGSDQILGPNQSGLQRDIPPHLHAPQGVVPLSLNMQSETATASSGPSRVASTIPDFTRGFGLDIPEEDEEELESFEGGVTGGPLPEEGEDAIGDDSTTAPAHSRHVSRVSIALSLKSMGGRNGIVDFEDGIEIIEENPPPELERPVQWNLETGPSFDRAVPVPLDTEVDPDPVGEWTASEDERSLGEYSNPSDEERVRQARREAKARGRSHQDQEMPRRLPNFPRPPEGGPTLVQHAPSATDEDIVSNPSEEGRPHDRSSWLYPIVHQQDLAQYQPIEDGRLRSPRPLPPLPHSRTASGNHSLHSAMIHSRDGSSMFNETDSAALLAGSMHAPGARRDSLNPFAKPFVFGSGSFGSNQAESNSQQEQSEAGHARQQSLGRMLNAAAAEFKPTGFTFRLPEGVPSLSFHASEASRPLPPVPMGISPSRFQGREKRQRRGSSADGDHDEGEEERDEREMNSFRFPSSSPLVNTKGIFTQSETMLRAISPMPQRRSELNAAAPPFAFPGTGSLTLPFASKEPSSLPYPLVPAQSAARSHSPIPEMQTQSDPGMAATPEVETKETLSETAGSAHPSPSPVRKRPPVLDFKHPVSTNTVPASLFRKALVGADLDGSTRASVRSRLSSREIFDHMNSPSLDDTNVPKIARKSNVPHPRVTSALQDRADQEYDQHSDIFTLPDHGDATSRAQRLQVPTSAIASPVSESMHAPYLRRSEEADQIDQRLEDLLDDRMEVVRKDLVEAQASATEQVVGQVITAIRSHISELVTRRQDEGVADARGEVDFELVRNTLEQGVMDIRTGLRHDLEEVLRSVELANTSRERPVSGLPADFQRVMEEFGNRTVSAVTSAVVKFASRIDQIDEFARVRATDERELLLSEMFSVLAPRLESFRQQPMDFDIVTAKLAEAVKPHISQLIDLTSDKKETAGLIVQRLMPALSALSQTPAHVDTDAIVSQLRVEVARMAPSSDLHVIKEAVADLVVERLDSRLAVREKAASSEQLYSRISERIDDLHAPVSDVRKAVEDLRMGQDSIREQGTTLNTLHQDMAAQLLSLPATIEHATATIQAARDEWTVLKNSSPSVDIMQPLPHLESIESTVRGLATNHEYLASQAASLISLHEDLKSRVSTLPQSLEEATASLKQVQVELLSRSRTPDQSGEVRNLLASNAELQVQIAKARGAHGQIRVEKDLMWDRMTAAESERNGLRAQLEDMKSKSSAKETEVTAAGLRITELEDALSHSLARLQSSDVTAQAKEERIATLERQNRDLGLEQYQFKSQIQKLELQSEWLTRDKDTLEQRLSQLQKDYDTLANQQTHWEGLRRTSEQVEQLTRLIGAADSEELAGLKRDRDRCKILEGEHASLQKRYKDQEARFVNLDRASQAVRQNLVQAQQRASEWEKRTQELETELDATRARLDDSDEAKLQLDSDLSLVKMHLEEKEAAEKVSKERDSKMRAEISSLEAQVASLKAELEKIQQTRRPVVVTASPASGSPGRRGNGYLNGQDTRPASRASTAYGGQSPVTPTDTAYRNRKLQSHTPSVPPDSPQGVWGSMHAPRLPTQHSSNALPYPPRSSIPSPTPSTVSLAPTQGDDGWWS